MNLFREIGLGLLFVIVPGVKSSPAQCVTLGTPGLTGCASFNGLLPSINCNGTSPTVGNSGFSLAGNNFQPAPLGTPCGVYAPAVVFLVLGPCATSPIPVLCGTAPLCNGSFLTLAYVDYFAFQVLVAPAVLPSFPGFSPIWLVPIPNDSTLVGATVCAQAIQGIFIALSGPAFCLQPPLFSCFAISNGIQITVLP